MNNIIDRLNAAIVRASRSDGDGLVSIDVALARDVIALLKEGRSTASQRPPSTSQQSGASVAPNPKRLELAMSGAKIVGFPVTDENGEWLSDRGLKYRASALAMISFAFADAMLAEEANVPDRS